MRKNLLVVALYSISIFLHVLQCGRISLYFEDVITSGNARQDRVYFANYKLPKHVPTIINNHNDAGIIPVAQVCNNTGFVLTQYAGMSWVWVGTCRTAGPGNRAPPIFS